MTILEHLDTALSCERKEGPSVAGSRGDVGTMGSPVQNSIDGRPRSFACLASCVTTGRAKEREREEEESVARVCCRSAHGRGVLPEKARTSYSSNATRSPPSIRPAQCHEGNRAA